MINSFVAYKGKPARITSQTTHKFELLLSDGSVRRVREKDFRFIHPEFAEVEDLETSADFTILDDFQGELLSLKEITEWLFDVFSPQNAWNAYLLVEDGMYAFWQKDKVFVRPKEQVDKIRSKRELERMESESLEKCINNIKNNTFEDSDLVHMESIERVALNKSKHAKILSALKIENSPEEAHRLLIKLKYLTNSFNPYPQRNQILIDSDCGTLDNDITRVDLTHLKSYAIDNTGSSDADDAISIDGDKVWVHIADVSCLVESNSDLDLYAQNRASNLYLPDQTIHMLPASITPLCALGISETSKALSVGFSISDEEVVDIEIIHSVIRVTKICYDDANLIIDSDKDLAKLQEVAKLHKKLRNNNGAISLDLPNVDVRLNNDKASITPQNTSPSRDLVAEMMVLAGRVVAKFAIDNDIAMPFAVQDKGDFPQEILDNSDSLTLSESFKATKHFKRSSVSTKIKPHSGMGLGAYVRVTSPLRRYLDLLVHQQLSSFIANKETLGDEEIKKIVRKINSIMPNINRTIRSSNNHYRCLYLLQNPKWRGEGVVVDTNADKAIVMIPSLGMITQIKTKTTLQMDERIDLKVVSIDICKLSVDFNKC